jgi:hypothetical protein
MTGMLKHDKEGVPRGQAIPAISKNPVISGSPSHGAAMAANTAISGNLGIRAART